MTKIWMTPLLMLAISATIRAQQSGMKVSVARWPHDHSAAISLTFDDGINTHLDVVGPILKKHHLNGTFFVATRIGPWEKRKPEWKQLAGQGNEIGNHTVNHPCMLPQITPHSQDYTPQMMEAEIRDAADEISKLLNWQRGLTFAYPCGNMSFGKPQDEVANSALYIRYVSEHAFAARAVGRGPENPDEMNILAINDLGATAGKDFPALLQLAEPAIEGHSWGVYCFHGVGGDWLSITPEALDQLAGYLEQHSEIWTATFGDVVRYIQESKAASIQVVRSDSNSLDLALTWPMDKKIYDLPLTLKIEVPQAWKNVIATGDGKRLDVAVKELATGTVMLIDIAPQTTKLRITGR